MSAKSILTRGAAGLAYVSLTSELSNIASGIDDELKEVMREQAEKVADMARQNAPVGSGNLKDSIEVYEYDRPGKVGFRVRAGARSTPSPARPDGVPYGHMVEYGSVHNAPARPFLIPALEAHREETIKAMNDKIGEMAS